MTVALPACALDLGDLCLPAAYASAARTVGVVRTVGPTARRRPDQASRLGLILTRVTEDSLVDVPAVQLHEACVGQACVVFRSACSVDARTCTYQLAPLVGPKVVLHTYVVAARSPAARQAAEAEVKVRIPSTDGVTFVPISLLAKGAAARNGRYSAPPFPRGSHD